MIVKIPKMSSRLEYALVARILPEVMLERTKEHFEHLINREQACKFSLWILLYASKKLALGSLWNSVRSLDLQLRFNELEKDLDNTGLYLERFTQGSIRKKSVTSSILSWLQDVETL